MRTTLVGRHIERRNRELLVVNLLLVVAALGLAIPADSVAWPAVQDVTGVHLCDSRPHPQPYGLWACRSGASVYQGHLVDVSRGPTPGPPGTTPPGGPPPFGPYGRSVPPPRQGFGGYDELDPWLGGRSER